MPLPHPLRKPKATTNAIRRKLFMSGEVKGQFTPRPVTEQRQRQMGSACTSVDAQRPHQVYKELRTPAFFCLQLPGRIVFHYKQLSCDTKSDGTASCSSVLG